MDAPTAPPKSDLPQVPGVQPPPNSEYGANPPPVVVQPQETGYAGYPPNNPQPNLPPYQQPGYPQPGQQPYPAPGQQPYPPPGQQPYPAPGQQPYPAPGQQPYPPPGQQPYPPPGQQPYPPPGQQPYPPPGQQPYPPPGQQQYPPPIQQPITGQPGAGEWMPLLQGYQNPNCPPGLEYLTAIDQLLVHQEVEIMEILTGFETANKYTVKNSMGQKIFYASEKSNCCARQFCGPLRPFGMQIVDNHGQEVLHLDRPLACSACCYPCCLQTVQVSAPPGTIIGSVKQEWSICKPKFSIQDASGETVLIIRGPVCTISCCGDVKFNVYSKDGETKVGKISKQWSGYVREAFTDADMFGINFPIDLDVKIKATLLGACFLIDFMFFEEPAKKDND